MQEPVSAEIAEPPLDCADDAPKNLYPVVPEYLRKVYWWAYLHPTGVRIFERQWLVNLILWGNFVRLRNSALDEMGTVIDGRTLQVACVYGDFTEKLAMRLAPGANLDVVDVTPIQLQNLNQKIGSRRGISLDCQNAGALAYEDSAFDQVVVFFLLHELPVEVRKKAISEALRVVRPGGKVVFVDYHRPRRWHPHRYLMPMILRTLEPFAMDLWKHEISYWLPQGITPSKIEKTLYFGGLYQKLVITR
jgi:ubiquinone/menaquinone biosynthesis C-methylase UbiE